MNMNYKLSIQNLYFGLICLLVSSCVATSGINRTSAISASDVNPANFKTYGWYQEQPAAAQEFEKGFNNDLNNHLRKSIEEALQKKGYRKATSNPDVLVAYDVSVSVPLEKDAPGTYPPGFGYSYAYMAGYRYAYRSTNVVGYRAVDLFKKGTLIIDLIDPATSELLWRGWSEEGISNFNAGYNKVKSQAEEVLKGL